MAHHYRSPYSGGFALTAGIMGAIVGGLKYQLDANTAALAQQAEMEKEQRLAQLQQQMQMGQEDRANTEWTRRNAIEADQQAQRDERTANLDVQKSNAVNDHAAANDLTKLGAENQLTLTREQQMQAQRAEDARRQAAFEADQQRRNHVYTRTFDAVAGEKDPNYFASQRGGVDGVYGSDGKWYPKGTPLPTGITPAVGFGATNLGTRGTYSGRPGSLRAGMRPGTVPGATAPATPPAMHFNAPDGAVQMLKQNPNLKPMFDQKYGVGAADYYLGGQ